MKSEDLAISGEFVSTSEYTDPEVGESPARIEVEIIGPDGKIKNTLPDAIFDHFQEQGYPPSLNGKIVLTRDTEILKESHGHHIVIYRNVFRLYIFMVIDHTNQKRQHVNLIGRTIGKRMKVQKEVFQAIDTIHSDHDIRKLPRYLRSSIIGLRKLLEKMVVNNGAVLILTQDNNEKNQPTRPQQTRSSVDEILFDKELFETDGLVFQQDRDDEDEEHFERCDEVLDYGGRSIDLGTFLGMLEGRSRKVRIRKLPKRENHVGLQDMEDPYEMDAQGSDGRAKMNLEPPEKEGPVYKGGIVWYKSPDGNRPGTGSLDCLRGGKLTDRSLIVRCSKIVREELGAALNISEFLEPK